MKIRKNTLQHIAVFCSFFCSPVIATAQNSNFLNKQTNRSRQTKLVSVPISFIDALDTSDSDASERFKAEFESAILEGTKRNKSKLKNCGYEFHSMTEFFEASDSLRSKESAAKAEKNGAWLIVGPARSNNYLLEVKGAPNTASISILASSKEVVQLGGHHLTLSHSNVTLARTAVMEVNKRNVTLATQTYVSIVSDSCLTCNDFASEFKSIAQKSGATQLKSFAVQSENPDVSEIQQYFASLTLPPDFVLLPNYSMVSSRIMAKLTKVLPVQTYFVGADGWGTSKFGYVQNASDLSTANGFSVRGMPPSQQAMAHFATGRKLLRDSRENEYQSSTSLGVLYVLDKLTTALCQWKPDSKATFRNLYALYGTDMMRPPWLPTIYSLKAGVLRPDGFSNQKYLSSRAISK